MRTANNWNDYIILDTSDGEKLEKWGKVSLVRPDPQIIWKTDKKDPLWKGADGHYHRSNKGGGEWEFRKKLPDSWKISYGPLTFNIRPTGFKHTGLFPEQAVNWDFMADKIRSAGREINVLNLFAYTGGATCALAKSGAHVVHVDAAKSIVSWAKDNLNCSGLGDKPVRFIVDDCMKFVLREQRRGNKYDGILMDPPSYGRGPNGEMWKIEESLYKLVEECVKLLSDDARFMLINSYTTGLAPSVLKNVLRVALKDRKCNIESDEIGLHITRDNLVLPCGASGRAELL